MRKSNTITKLLLIVCVLVVLADCGGDNGSRGDVEQRIYTLLEKVCKETATPGVTVYIRNSKFGNFYLAWGLADLKTRTPMTTASLLRIGSLTKSFTGEAVLRLAQEGLIDMDAPIARYLPGDIVAEYPPLWNITVRQAMNMSSGLPEYLSNDFVHHTVLKDPLRHYTPEELVLTAFNLSPTLLFPPGSRWVYTNTNYILLAMMIENVSGLSYQKYIEENFIKPLGLTHTHVMVDATVLPGMAHGYYDSNGDKIYEDWTKINMSVAWAAGCIVSTAEDAAKWMETVATGKLVTKEFQPYLYRIGQPVNDEAVYTAGLLVIDHFGIGHNGGWVGFHCDAWFSPPLGTTVAVLSNCYSYVKTPDSTRTIVKGIFSILETS